MSFFSGDCNGGQLEGLGIYWVGRKPIVANSLSIFSVLSQPRKKSTFPHKHSLEPIGDNEGEFPYLRSCLEKDFNA